MLFVYFFISPNRYATTIVAVVPPMTIKIDETSKKFLKAFIPPPPSIIAAITIMKPTIMPTGLEISNFLFLLCGLANT